MTQNELIEMPVHYVVGGVYAKELELRVRGAKVKSHAHKFDHLSLLAQGMVAVTADGVRRVYTAPTGLTIVAGVEHEIEALTDGVLWYCVHQVPEELRTEVELDGAVVVGKG